MRTRKSKNKAEPVIHSFMKVPGYQEIRDRFTYPEGDVSNIVEPKNATEIDRFKIKLCHLIDGYRIERQLKKKEVARILGIDEARMSEMMNGKIERYSIERLFGYLKALNPGFKLSLEYRELK